MISNQEIDQTSVSKVYKILRWKKTIAENGYCYFCGGPCGLGPLKIKDRSWKKFRKTQYKEVSMKYK